MSKTLVAAVIALAAMVLFAIPSFADNVESNAVAASPNGIGGVITVSAGGTAVVPYWISETGSGGLEGCDAADGSPVTVTIHTGSLSVTADPTSLEFSACGDVNTNSQTVTFSTDANDTGHTYDITVTTQDANGNYNETPAAFKLKVESAGGGGGSTNTPPDPGTISGLATVDEGSSHDYISNASDADAGDTLTYEWSVTAGNATISAGQGTNTVTLDFPDGPDSVTLHLSVSDGTDTVSPPDLAITENNVKPTIGSFSVQNGSAVACIGGNTVSVSFSVTDPADNTHDPITGTMTWGDGNTTNISGRSVSESHVYAAGSYTLSVSVNDGDGGTDTAGGANGGGSISLLYNTSGVLQPMNDTRNGLGLPSVFKFGSTIPVKIRVTDCNGSSVGGLTDLKVTYSKLSGDTPVDGEVETTSTSAADTSPYMRYDATAGQYIYNMATKPFPDSSAKYRLYIRGAEIHEITTDFGLKK